MMSKKIQVENRCEMLRNDANKVNDSRRMVSDGEAYRGFAPIMSRFFNAVSFNRF